jgi:hypothetical protein
VWFALGCGGGEKVPAPPAPVTVTISPSAVSLEPGAEETFTDTVAGTSNQDVSWSVSGGGTIDANGHYTAPSTAGVYQVVVTSAANPTVRATATVTVTARPQGGVTVDPPAATLDPGQSLSFTAQLTNLTGGVMWSVTESSGGTIDNNGNYVAPAVAGTYHVVATSVANPSIMRNVVVTVDIKVTITPPTATLNNGQTQTFATALFGTSNLAVTYTIQEGPDGGTIDASGNYTAPATLGTYHVIATSVADQTRAAVATVTVTATPQIAVSFSPSSVPALAEGAAQTVNALVANAVNTGVTYSVLENGGGAIDGSGHYTAPFAAGTYHIVATSVADAAKTAILAVTVKQAQLALDQTMATLDQGAQVTFTPTLTNITANDVTFRVVEGTAGGSVTAAGVYTAPPAAGTYHVAVASTHDASATASATIVVRPVGIMVAPSTAMVLQGGTQTFTAQVTGSIETGVLWSVQAGGGTIDPAGTYHAPTQAGSFTVTATAAADATQQATITVIVPQVEVMLGARPMALDQGQSYDFTAQVTGAANTAVAWMASAGPIDGAGHFTAPKQAGNVSITATSLTSATSATYMVVVNPVVITFKNPPSGTLDQGTTLAFQASVTGAVDTSITWSVAPQCGLVNPTTGAYTAGHQAAANCTLIATSNSDGTAASAPFAVAAVQVVVSPNTGRLAPQQSQGFVATVTGTVLKSVTWSLASGGAGGTVNALGVYYAAATTGTDTVRATSVWDTTSQGSAQITVTTQVQVAVTPAVLNMTTGTLQNFAAVVTGTTNSAVTWTASSGLITPGGQFQAGAIGTTTITATSQADGSAVGTATVNVTSMPQVGVVVTPAALSLSSGQSSNFFAQVTGTSNGQVIWSVLEPAGGSIDASGDYVAPTAAGTYHVIATSVADPTRTGVGTITISTGPPVSVAISPQGATVPPTGTLLFHATVTGTSNQNVMWSAGCGTIDSSGLFTAPNAFTGFCSVVATSVVDQTRFTGIEVHVTGTVAVAISPPQNTLVKGDQQQLQASVTGTTTPGVTWSIVADPGNEGTLSAGGLFDTSGGSASPPYVVTVKAVATADGTTAATAQLTVVASTLHVVSGTLSYGGAVKLGHIFLTVDSPNGNVAGGTELDAPGTYSIRCLQNGGMYTLSAWSDQVGNIQFVPAADPSAKTSFSFDGSHDVTGINLALADATPSVPGGVQIQTVAPLDGGALVFIQGPRDPQGNDAAAAYTVYVSTVPNPGPTNSILTRVIPDSDDNVAVISPLGNGSYYFGVAATNSAGTGPINAPASPVAIGPAQTGGIVISGSVDLTGIAVTGPLGIVLAPNGTPSSTLYGKIVPNPIGVVGFDIAGVQPGNYKVVIVLDQLGDGALGLLDPKMELDQAITNSMSLGTIVPPNVGAGVTTDHEVFLGGGGPGEGYAINVTTRATDRIPLRARLIAGPNLGQSVPLDIGYVGKRGADSVDEIDFLNLTGAASVGDAYSVLVTYDDGTTQVLKPAVNAVVPAATNLSPQGAGAGVSPTFSWRAPTPAPATFSYELFVTTNPFGPAFMDARNLPSTTTSVPYSGQPLVAGASDVWVLRITDGSGNRADMQVPFSP